MTRMVDVWWIGPSVLGAMAGTAIVARLARHRHAGPLAIAAVVAGSGYAVGWALARRAMRGHAGTFESAFIQLAFAQVATFVFVGVAMVAAWRRGRRKSE